MPNDPSYVRLANRLTRGIVADIGNSGWSISGFDVQPFPKDDEPAARFVRRELRDGKLEPASKAEYEEVTETHKVLEGAPHQEAALQSAAREANAKLAENRGVDDDDDEDDYLADVEERLKAQKEDETDDPEEQVARNATRPAAKKKKSKKAKAKASVEE